jgi:hypothetical protein
MVGTMFGLLIIFSRMAATSANPTLKSNPTSKANLTLKTNQTSKTNLTSKPHFFQCVVLPLLLSLISLAAIHIYFVAISVCFNQQECNEVHSVLSFLPVSKFT